MGARRSPANRWAGPTIDTATSSEPVVVRARHMAVMSGSTAPVRVTTAPGRSSAAPSAEPASGTSWPTQPTWRIARLLSAAATYVPVWPSPTARYADSPVRSASRSRWGCAVEISRSRAVPPRSPAASRSAVGPAEKSPFESRSTYPRASSARRYRSAVVGVSPATLAAEVRLQRPCASTISNRSRTRPTDRGTSASARMRGSEGEEAAMEEMSTDDNNCRVLTP